MDLVPEHWQMGCERIQERISYLIQSGQWSDCKFSVGSEPSQEVIEGHKMILASASPVFEAMFFGDLAESNNPILIPDIQPKTFRTLLTYIYADHLKLNSLDEAIKLYYAAKKYILPHLVKQCMKYVTSCVSSKNACRLYEFALLFDEKELENKCLQLIKSQTYAVITDSSFDDAQLSTVVTICSFDSINCTEIDLFEAVHKYSKSQEKHIDRSSCGTLKLEPSVSKDIVVVNMESSGQNGPEGAIKIKQDMESPSAPTAPQPSESKEKPNIRTALEKIRFLTLTPQEFANGPAKSSLLTEGESFAIFMNIASSTESSVPMPSGFSICRQKREKITEVKAFTPQFNFTSGLNMK